MDPFDFSTPASVVPHIGKNGVALSEKERAKIAKKKGVCLHCGVKTHKVTMLKRAPLSNDDVHKGICIKCNPNEVPHGVLMEYERRNNANKVTSSVSSGSRTNSNNVRGSKNASGAPGFPTGRPNASTASAPGFPTGRPNASTTSAPGFPTGRPNASTTAAPGFPTGRPGAPKSAARPAPSSPKPPAKPSVPAPKQTTKRSASVSDDSYEAPIVKESKEVRMARAKAWQQVAGAKMEEEEAEKRANEARNRLQGIEDAQPAAQRSASPNNDPYSDSYEAPIVKESQDVRMARAKAWQEVAGAKMEEEEAEKRANEARNRLQDTKPAPQGSTTPNNDPYSDSYEAPVVKESKEVRMARAKAWQQVAGAKMDEEEAEVRANEARTRLQQGIQDGTMEQQQEAEEQLNEAFPNIKGHHEEAFPNLQGNQDPYQESHQQAQEQAVPLSQDYQAARPASTGRNEVQLTIDIPPDQNFTITLQNASEATTVKQMKEEIQKAKGIPVKQQEICLDYATVLVDQELLLVYNLLGAPQQGSIVLFHSPAYPCRQIFIDFFGEKHRIAVSDPGRDNVDTVLHAIQCSPWFSDQLRYMSPEEVQLMRMRLSWEGKLLDNPKSTLADFELPDQATLHLDVFQDNTVNNPSTSNQAPPVHDQMDLIAQLEGGQQDDDPMAIVARLQQEAFASFQD